MSDWKHVGDVYETTRTPIYHKEEESSGGGGGGGDGGGDAGLIIGILIAIVIGVVCLGIAIVNAGPILWGSLLIAGFIGIPIYLDSKG